VNALPLFPVTTVGSWPRPPAVLAAQRQLRLERIGPAEFDRVADEAVQEVVRLQEQAGCDMITDGELRRDNFYSFVARKFAGVRLMTLAEMLDVGEDKVGFERLLANTGRAGLRDQSPCLRRPDRAARAARRRRSAVPAAPHRPAGEGYTARPVSPYARDVEVRHAVERALRLYAPEQIFLNPDCGFGTFSRRPMNSPAVALAKLQAMVGAARDLRG